MKIYIEHNIILDMLFLILEFRPNSPVFKRNTRKSNIPLPSASSVKDLSVCFN